MKTTIQALLGPPGSGMFRPYSFVSQNFTGQIRTHGSGRDRILQSEEFLDLLEEGYAVPLPPIEMEVTPSTRLLWRGDRFKALSADLLIFTEGDRFSIPGGSFSFLSEKEGEDRITIWLQRAARQARTCPARAPQLHELALQTDPNHPITEWLGWFAHPTGRDWELTKILQNRRVTRIVTRKNLQAELESFDPTRYSRPRSDREYRA